MKNGKDMRVSQCFAHLDSPSWPVLKPEGSDTFTAGAPGASAVLPPILFLLMSKVVFSSSIINVCVRFVLSGLLF